MANNRSIHAGLDKGLKLIFDEQHPNKSIEIDRFGNIAPELDILSGRNIMPTVEGYTSFFGVDDLVLSHDISIADIEDIVAYKTQFNETVLLAMCKDGVYVKSLAGEDATATVVETATEITVTAVNGKCSWKRGCYSSVPSPNLWKLWTYAILENKLYFYQKGQDYIAYFHSTNPGVYVFEKLNPSYIISTVAAAYSWIIDIDQEYGNSTYKTLNAGFGNSTIYPASSADAAETVNDMVATFNVVNAGQSTSEVTSVVNTITDIDAVITLDDLPLDFNITDMHGNLIPYLSWGLVPPAQDYWALTYIFNVEWAVIYQLAIVTGGVTYSIQDLVSTLVPEASIPRYELYVRVIEAGLLRIDPTSKVQVKEVTLTINHQSPDIKIYWITKNAARPWHLSGGADMGQLLVNQCIEEATFGPYTMDYTKGSDLVWIEQLYTYDWSWLPAPVNMGLRIKHEVFVITVDNTDTHITVADKLAIKINTQHPSYVATRLGLADIFLDLNLPADDPGYIMTINTFLGDLWMQIHA